MPSIRIQLLAPVDRQMLPCSVDDDKSWVNVSLQATHRTIRLERTYGEHLVQPPAQGRTNWIKLPRVSSFENSQGWQLLHAICLQISIYKWICMFAPKVSFHRFIHVS